MKNFLSKILITLAVALGFATLATTNVFAAQDYDFNLGFWAQTGPQAGTVQLTWNDPSFVNNYNIAYGTAPGSYQYGAVGVGNVGAYLVSGLQPGTKYYFALSPIVNNRGLGYSPETSAVAAKTTTGQVKGPVSQASFSAPQGGPTADQYQLTAKPGPMSGQVTLSWIMPGGATNVDVVYGTQGGGYTYGAQNVGQGSNQVISGLVPGWVYYFAVLAENNNTPVAPLSMPVAQASM